MEAFMVIGLVVAVFVVISIGIVIATILIFRRRKTIKAIHGLGNNVDNHDHLFDRGMQRSMFSKGMCDDPNNKL
jgi:hypothetical protein